MPECGGAETRAGHPGGVRWKEGEGTAPARAGVPRPACFPSSRSCWDYTGISGEQPTSNGEGCDRRHQKCHQHCASRRRSSAGAGAVWGQQAREVTQWLLCTDSVKEGERLRWAGENPARIGENAAADGCLHPQQMVWRQHCAEPLLGVSGTGGGKAQDSVGSPAVLGVDVKHRCGSCGRDRRELGCAEWAQCWASCFGGGGAGIGLKHPDGLQRAPGKRGMRQSGADPFVSYPISQIWAFMGGSQLSTVGGPRGAGGLCVRDQCITAERVAQLLR